jgi:hypothetical protein
VTPGMARPLPSAVLVLQTNADRIRQSSSSFPWEACVSAAS